MDNQQLNFLNNNQLQVFLSGILGDGYIATSNSNSTYFGTNCKYEEYITYKQNLLGDLFKHKSIVNKNGYKKSPIWTLRSKSLKELLILKNMSIQDILNNLDELGLALWVYDDSSLHKTDLFYNLNTQVFSKEINENIFIPFLKEKFNIIAKLGIEHKKDGRIFYYLRISKYTGASIITSILNKYLINCYSYKRWSSETIQKWSKVQEYLKSTDKVLTSRQLSSLMKTL